MLDHFESLYGPYPFAGEKYGHAEFIWPGAMEHQTVTSIGSGSVVGDGSRDWLIVHELGHQWFGDSLTPATWADIWLNEGFATYSEALWREHTGGEPAYRQRMDLFRNDTAWVIEGPVYDPVPVFPGRVIYDKGAWILHALRGRLGDAAFFGLLGDWASGGVRPRGLVATQEFVDLAGSWAGEDLNGFLWPYLTSNELPRVRFSYRIVDGDAGPGTRVELTVGQTGTGLAGDPLFDLVLPVEITTATGVQEVQVRLDQGQVTPTFELASTATQVRLDPDQRALWQPAQVAAPVEGLDLVFPNPSRGGYVVFRYWLNGPATSDLRIYDAMGREVARRRIVGDLVGYNEYGWDVADASGAKVASGVYWATLEIAGRRSVIKFSVVR